MDIDNEDQNMTTRQKILVSAVRLFATKGFTETTVRDIATVVGINSASIYYYFPTKDDILKSLFLDYGKATKLTSSNDELSIILKENPTVDGVMDCLQLDYTKLKQQYYVDILHMGHQEQHRNDYIRSISIRTIETIEKNVAGVFAELQKLNVISQDADPDFWKKAASSLAHTMVCRTLLGNGETSPGFEGMDLSELLRFMFGLVFKLYKSPDNDDAE